MHEIPTDRQDDQPQIDPTSIPDDAVILDVRNDDEWELGHAPGAIHIPLHDLPARLADLPDPDDGTLAVTCRGGGRASRAVAWLNANGFDAANLTDGMLGWKAAGRSLVTDGDHAPDVR